MTRKSKREIERVLTDADPGTVDYRDLLEYLELVAEQRRDAPLPTEHFGPNADWGEWTDAVPAPGPDELPPGVDVEALTPVERFGLRYMGADVQRGIIDMRLTAGRDEEVA